MDPVATVQRIREAIKDYHEANVSLNPQGCEDALYELQDATIDLLEWLDRGGFCPFHQEKNWKRPEVADHETP